MNVKRLLLMSASGLALVGGGFFGTRTWALKSGESLLSRGAPTLAKAQERLGLAYKMGSSRAAYRLGMIHWDGLSVDVDFKEAMKWLKPAADGGDPDALFKVGVAYRYGQGVEKDEKKGQSYVHEASNLGQPVAMATLAEDLLAGDHGEAKDGAEAYRLAKAAAEKGDPDGMFLLGRMFLSLAYPEGALVKDIKGSPQEGLRWMEKAAEAGIYRKHSPSCFVIGAAYLAMPNQDATEFLTSRLLGASDYPTNFGSVAATISSLNADGKSMPRDLQKAERFLIKAAKLGARGAGELLIRKGFQDRAMNPSPDPVKAKKVMEDLVVAGDSWAPMRLGIAYYDGDKELGIQANRPEAMRLLTLSDQRGEKKAQELLGVLRRAQQAQEQPIQVDRLGIYTPDGFPRVQALVKNTSNNPMDALVAFDLVSPNGVILQNYQKTLFGIPPGGTQMIDIAIAPYHQDARVQLRDVKWR